MYVDFVSLSCNFERKKKVSFVFSTQSELESSRTERREIAQLSSDTRCMIARSAYQTTTEHVRAWCSHTSSSCVAFPCGSVALVTGRQSQGTQLIRTDRDRAEAKSETQLVFVMSAMPACLVDLHVACDRLQRQRYGSLLLCPVCFLCAWYAILWKCLSMA